MPAMSMPPQAVNPPAIVAHADTVPSCHYLSDAEAQVAFARIKRALPSTHFIDAKPSEICGLVHVEMANGMSAYTDPTGRFFLLAFALDTARGSPADNSQALDNQVAKRQQFPTTPIPGVMPTRDGS
jgi:hypothetical protein